MKKIIFFLVAILSLQCGKSQDSESASSSKMLTLINKQRQQGCNCGNRYFPPVPPVKWNATLEKVAKNHSSEMQKNNKLDHYSKDGKDAGDRLSKAGYKWTTYAENVAMGQDDEESVMKSWLKSKGHCANIMNAQVTEVGEARSGAFWTQLFAAPAQ